MNKEQVPFSGLRPPDNYANWVMPRMDIDTLYKIGTFEFKKAYSVKTHEEAISLQSGM